MSLSAFAPNYPEYDNNKAIEYALDVANKQGGFYTDGTALKFSKPIDERQKIVDRQSIPGHTSDQLAVIENLFHNKINEYESDTLNMIVLDDLSKANEFATLTVDTNMDRLNKDLKTATNDLQKTKTKYMATIYEIDYQKFLINVIKLSLFFLVLTVGVYYLFANDSIGQTGFFVLLGIVWFIYIIFIIWMIKSLQMRRKDDFNKFYFFTKETEQKRM